MLYNDYISNYKGSFLLTINDNFDCFLDNQKINVYFVNNNLVINEVVSHIKANLTVYLFDLV